MEPILIYILSYIFVGFITFVVASYSGLFKKEDKDDSIDPFVSIVLFMWPIIWILAAMFALGWLSKHIEKLGER